MSELHLFINRIKNIESCDIEFPLERGLYAIVGENGCGKSTIMQAMSVLVKPSSLRSFREADYSNDSYIEIDIDNKIDKWHVENGQWILPLQRNGRPCQNNKFHGFYEGSIFYGSRFDDYNIVDSFLSESDFSSKIRLADSFVTETLSFILHGDKKHYQQLYKIKTKQISSDSGFKGIPYFLNCNGKFISQYNMSSGESMLISLIDFINNLTVRNRYVSQQPLLFLIDEAELALHPAAIDRLVSFFGNLVKTVNMVVIFSTHSTEIINRISPNNIFMIDNSDGVVNSLNPCYPNYAIRNLYVPNGYDFIILVEDELAKAVVERLIRSNNICQSKLWHVVPSGDWAQTLKLQKDIQESGLLGVGKRVLSILDGDIQSKGDVKAKEYNISLFLYLPIQSVEKYLYNKLIIQNDTNFIKLIGDKYFTRRSLADILSDYNNNYDVRKDLSGKKLYKLLCSNLFEVGISKEQFIQYLCEDICSYERFTDFIKSLSSILS